MNRFDHDGRKAHRTQLSEQPRREGLRLKADSMEPIRVALKSGADRRWLGVGLTFLDDLAVVVDDTYARLIHRHIETCVELHGDLPGCIAARESGQLCAF